MKMSRKKKGTHFCEHFCLYFIFMLITTNRLIMKMSVVKNTGICSSYRCNDRNFQVLVVFYIYKTTFTV